MRSELIKVSWDNGKFGVYQWNYSAKLWEVVLDFVDALNILAKCSNAGRIESGPNFTIFIL